MRLLLLAVLLCGCGHEADVLVVEAENHAASDSIEPRILLVRSPREDPRFGVPGLTDEQQSAVAALGSEARGTLLEAYVGSVQDAPPMAGSVTLDQGMLRFVPRYPLRPGVRYRVLYHPSRIPGGDAAAPDVVDEFKLAEPEPGPPTVVAHVYPTTDRLPANQLKFYFHFSAPMSRGEAYRRVHLLDADGQQVDAPFLELGEELWDPGMTRFTLLFDPGRVKRGLKPREDVGPVLEAGRRYTLVIDREWVDAGGHPLAGEMRKSFDVLPADEAPIDVDAWRIEPPKAGTSEPLVVRFGEPLDHSLLERVVHVVGPHGAQVAGSIEVTDDETYWRFTPGGPWTPGDYQLVADTTLEDLAGNSIGRAFDVDVFAPVGKRITTETVAIAFSIDDE